MRKQTRVPRFIDERGTLCDSSHNAKSANRIQPESLKYVPMRKVARVMALVAGALSSGIVAFSIAEAAWAWAAVFAAVAAVAFYLAYAMTVDLREAR